MSKQDKYFLSDIFTAKDPVEFKFINLETGVSFRKNLQVLSNDWEFLSELRVQDVFQIGFLSAMRVN